MLLKQSMQSATIGAGFEEGSEDLELLELQGEFEAAFALSTELELATILGEFAPKFASLGDEAKAVAQAFYGEMGEGCTLEGVGANLKSFGAKAKEALKQLWAKFVELMKRAFLNVQGKIAKFKQLKSKVGGLGSEIVWSNKDMRVYTYVKDGSVIDKDAGGKPTANALVKGLTQVSYALGNGKWTVTKADLDESLTDVEKFWESYKEQVRASKEKGTSWSAADSKDVAGAMAKALEAGADQVAVLEILLGAEKLIKAVKIKDLNVSADTVDPKAAVRRVTRQTSIAIVAHGNALGAVNKILGNVKKA